MLHGLRVSYTVHIPATIRRPFSLSLSLLLNPNKAKRAPTALCHPSRACSFIIPVQHFQNQCLDFVSC